MRPKSLITYTIALFLLLGLSACGGGAEEPAEEADGAATAAEGGLSPEEMEKGIGPIREVSLGEIDAALAAQGEEIYNMKCTACHKMEERYVGPPLGDVLDRRAPEFVMNMILNPAEMVEKHPEVKAMLAQYLTPMPNQSLTEEEARAVLEYLRQVHTGDLAAN